MKKFVLPLVIVLVAAAGTAFLILQHRGTRLVKPAELVPADTLLYAEVSDWPRTAERWQKTALFQLWREPEMQAFMEKPRAKLPSIAEWEGKLDQFARLKPRQAFAAVTTLEGNSPHFIAGFSFGASRDELEKMLAEPRAQLRRTFPAGKADILPYGSAEIQVYTDKENTMAEAYRGKWYFVSNQVELLRATIDRFDQQTVAANNTLAGEDTFRKTLAPLPADGELTVFARVSVLTDRLSTLLSAAGQKTDPAQMAELKKTQAMAFSTKTDGELFRDTFFSYAPGSTPGAPLPRTGLSMSTAATLLYYATILPAPSDTNASNALLPLTQAVPGLADFEKALAEKNLQLSDVTKAFGPELTVLIDWPSGTLTPTSLLSVDLRDAQKAKSFIEVFTSGPANAAGWTQVTHEGTTIYAPPPAPAELGFALPRPAIALSEKSMLIGLSPQAVNDGLAQAQATTAKLADQPAFQGAEKSVQPPTAAFAYLDMRSLVESSGAIFRPVLVMSLAFNPETGQYIDAGKLPSTETLTKHLGPSVYSQSVSEQGTLVQSTGALTFNQAIAAVAVSAGIAALPMIEQALKGEGGVLPQGLFPGMLSPLSPAQPSASAPPNIPGSPSVPSNPSTPPAPPGGAAVPPEPPGSN